MLENRALAKRCSEVVTCDICQRRAIPRVLRDEEFNVPQPGYIGPAYSDRRILFIGQNPGVSPKSARSDDERLAQLLLSISLDPSQDRYLELRAFLQEFMARWAITQRFLPLARFRLTMSEIAYINVVRCRTQENTAPLKAMVDSCVQQHLKPWLDALQPDIVVFLGKWAHDMAAPLVESRGIKYGFVNRSRSLSKAKREENLAEITELLGSDSMYGKQASGISKPSAVGPQPDEAPRACTEASQMPMESYVAILRGLGFMHVERGKTLKHNKAVPSVFINARRDGFVYFTVYRQDDALYRNRTNWRELPPQQKKDEAPQYKTVVPVAGRERQAFKRLLDGCC